ncbi:MAG TPA: tyrosine-protein phosphatase [Candidatus Limnocylindrales bacterium]|jgi:protein tyrosine/serine phosphatase|nr:tyrosine-protein phosphatase [Candidatus Limnocylindrales bacterium]
MADAGAGDRSLIWDGCVNVRDLGGIPTEDGRATRRGAVIRSDNIGGLTPDGWSALARHGVVRIVDLRWPEERAQDPPRDMAGTVEVVHVAVLGPTYEESAAFFRELDAHVDRVEDAADHYAYSYVEFLERNRARFAAALAAIADADGPVVIHCMGGKDRTGLVAALLLRLAGVSLDEIGDDYSLSGPNLAGTLDAWLESAPDERERARRLKLSTTPASAMARVIAAVEDRHGSVAGYLEQGGLDSDQIDRLRDRLRSEAAP